MNLCACLGVGPGNRLLLGPVTPAIGYDSTRAPAPPMAPIRMEAHAMRAPHVRRTKRGAAETKALYERVGAYIKAGLEAKRNPFELRDEVAKKEDIERSYVDYIVSKLKLAGRRRCTDEVKAFAQRARVMLAETGWTKRRVAAELGVSEPYLHAAMSRHPE